MCGKTIESLRRNVVTQIPVWLEGIFKFSERRSENKLIVTNGNTTNVYYLFGGKDESSYALIQGITLAGVLFDEVALMPRSFVEQAMARCSVAESKFWFNCNPEGPTHWFYTEWIQKSKQHNVLYLHFTMRDNLSLDPQIRERYEGMYSGIFYQRYILGEWKKAEGLVYPMFSRENHIANEHGTRGEYYISIDYGTINPTAMGLWRLYNGAATMEREYYHDSRVTKRQKTDAEYYQDLVDFVGDTPISRIIIDPSAASFKACIRQHGKFRVMDANNAVLDGIRWTATCISSGKIMIHKSCTATLNEFDNYIWDEKAQKDTVVKANDHSMDQMRYFCYTMRRLFRERSYNGFLLG